MEEIKQHCEKVIQILRSDYSTQLQYSGIIKKIYDVMLQIIWYSTCGQCQLRMDSTHDSSPNGKIGLVLANGALSTQSSGEGEIRKKIIEDDLIEGIIAMPTQLFYSQVNFLL